MDLDLLVHRRLISCGIINIVGATKTASGASVIAVRQSGEYTARQRIGATRAGGSTVRTRISWYPNHSIQPFGAGC